MWVFQFPTLFPASHALFPALPAKPKRLRFHVVKEASVAFNKVRMRIADKMGVDAQLDWDWKFKPAYGLLQLFYTWPEMKWCAAKRGGLEE